jgi:hypothetical protein
MIYAVIVFWMICQGQVIADQELTKTDGYQNGRSWNRMSESMKIGYITGVADGQNAMSIAIFDGLKNDGWSKRIETVLLDVVNRSFPILTKGEIIKELDAFFSEGANGPISVYNALVWVTAKAHGATHEDLDALVAALRRRTSSAEVKQ